MTGYKGPSCSCERDAWVDDSDDDAVCTPGSPLRADFKLETWRDGEVVDVDYVCRAHASDIIGDSLVLPGEVLSFGRLRCCEVCGAGWDDPLVPLQPVGPLLLCRVCSDHLRDWAERFRKNSQPRARRAPLAGRRRRRPAGIRLGGWLWSWS